MGTEARLVIYAALGAAYLAAFFWTFRQAQAKGSPRVTRPLTTSRLAGAVLCAALCTTSALQSWWPSEYFGVVEWVRWVLVIAFAVDALAFYWWWWR